MINSTIRAGREDFVSELSGTTIEEVVLVGCGLLSAYAFHSAISLLGGKIGTLLPTLALIFPLIIVVTLSRSFSRLASFGFLILANLIANFFTPTTRGPMIGRDISHVTSYRSILLLATCFSILAVDFPLFPRRHAKTETFGISLMDCGVGCMVFANGIVSGKPKLVPLKKILVRGAPLMILGLARPILLRIANYQVHISEFGADWNFFLTMGILVWGTAAISLFVPISYKFPLTLGVGFSVIHTAFLSYLGVQNYILNEPRYNFLTNNKEGIFTIPGYAAIYFFGAATRQHVLSRAPSQIILCIYATLYILLCHRWEGGHKPSRRLVNLEYICFIVMFSLLFNVGIIILDTLSRRQSPTPLLAAISKNQLALFLLANVLTGTINILANPMDMSEGGALVIMVFYMLIVCASAIYLERHKIHTKWW